MFNKLNTFLIRLAQDDTLKDIFGDGVQDAPLGNEPVSEGLAGLFGFAIQTVFVIAAIFVLVYLLWGVIDYIISKGEPEKTAAARQKMINAIVGMLLLVGVLTIWLVIVRDVLGIFGGSGGSFQFDLPSIRNLQSNNGGGSGSGGGGTGGGSGGGGGSSLVDCAAINGQCVAGGCPSGQTSIGGFLTTCKAGPVPNPEVCCIDQVVAQGCPGRCVRQGNNGTFTCPAGERTFGDESNCANSGQGGQGSICCIPTKPGTKNPQIPD